MNFLSSNIEFAGQVSDEELENLYENSEAILFPSLDEGLGLPILEAVNHNKKVVCSNIAVFKEFSTDAFYLFNPTNPEDIAEALRRAVLDKSKSYINKYLPIKEEFTWKNSAHRMLTSEISKQMQILTSKKRKYSIIVEQDESSELVSIIGSLVRNHCREYDVELFIDSLNYGSRNMPLVFNNILPTGDVVDAFRKTRIGMRTIIVTKNSKYTPSIINKGDEVIYLGVSKMDSQKTFRNIFKVKV